MKLKDIKNLPGVKTIEDKSTLRQVSGGCELMCRVAVTHDCYNNYRDDVECYNSGYAYCIEFCK